VDVTNTSPSAGDEVVQLYIGQRHGSAARPIRQLKGFQRISLQPGERRSVELVLEASELAYWSDAAQGRVQDETVIDIYVGGDSTAALNASFEVRA
jgi:beta-glucosidase